MVAFSTLPAKQIAKWDLMDDAWDLSDNYMEFYERVCDWPMLPQDYNVEDSALNSDSIKRGLKKNTKECRITFFLSLFPRELPFLNRYSHVYNLTIAQLCEHKTNTLRSNG